MAKPVDNKDDKNPNNKKPALELSPTMMLVINNIIMIIVITVLMLVMYLTLDQSFSKKISQLSPDAEEEMEEEVDEESIQKNERIILDLGDFILNLADVNTKRYIKVGVALELSKTQDEIEAEAAQAEAGGEKHGGHGEAAAPADAEATITAEMERYKPAIRDAIITILSNKTSEELSTPVGKEMAKDEIIGLVNGIFENQRKVLRVSFGQFIIQ